MANLMLVKCVIASRAEVWTSVLVDILSGVDSVHGTGPRRNGSVNSRSTLCPISTHLADYVCKLDNFFLTSQASKV